MGKSISTAMNNPKVEQNSLSARQIPTAAYTLQNTLISLANVVAALALLFVTVSVILPWSIIGAILLTKERPKPSDTTKKVVLVVGASRGIGMNVVMQYIDDPTTVIIAGSSPLDSLKIVPQLGDTRATVLIAKLDLAKSRKLIEETIKALDKQYGPISHFYAVSGISDHLVDQREWDVDTIMDITNINVVGTVTAIMAMYQLMRTRRYGKICIVGPLSRQVNTATMISYAATKSFIDTFSSSLRVLANPMGIDVVTVQPGFIGTRLTQGVRGQGSVIPGGQFGSPRGMARKMRNAMEKGSMGFVLWPGS